MGTKERMLELLENNKGAYLSGEEIAEKLEISRTAVWKAVKNLQNEGYIIDAVRNKGYSLSVETDILSAQGIRKYLKPYCMNLDLNVCTTVTSTNTFVREKAAEGVAEGYVLIAGMQTHGRGRSGRMFFSPQDTGVYMSLLLRPHHMSAKQAVKLTTMAAVAACEAIEVMSGKSARIKWVNDIYADEKKVGGILTEASVGLEDGCLEYVVLGIGMNVSLPKDGFPDELKSIAGAVFCEPVSDGKNRLAAEFLNCFMAYYTVHGPANYADNYRRRSLVLGKEVQVIFPDHQETALAMDVDEECHLIVKYEDGRMERLASGEIRVKIT